VIKYCKSYKALRAVHEPFFVRPGVLSGKWAFHFHDVHGIPMEFLPELAQERMSDARYTDMFRQSVLEISKRDKIGIEEAFCKFWGLTKGKRLRGNKVKRLKELFERARSQDEGTQTAGS